jgi:hypothetical protein
MEREQGRGAEEAEEKERELGRKKGEQERDKKALDTQVSK